MEVPFTPKACDSKAQGRAAHPGISGIARNRTPKGCNPLWHPFGVRANEIRLVNPGCAPRPWALELNRFAVAGGKYIPRMRTQGCAAHPGFPGDHCSLSSNRDVPERPLLPLATAKRLNPRAQGRAAHPGIPGIARNRTPKGCNS